MYKTQSVHVKDAKLVRVLFARMTHLPCLPADKELVAWQVEGIKVDFQYILLPIVELGIHESLSNQTRRMSIHPFCPTCSDTGQQHPYFR